MHRKKTVNRLLKDRASADRRSHLAPNGEETLTIASDCTLVRAGQEDDLFLARARTLRLSKPHKTIAEWITFTIIELQGVTKKSLDMKLL